jgi:hypothetical protein
MKRRKRMEKGEKEIKVEEGEGGVDDPLFQKI